MFTIRTAENLARVLDSPLDPELKQLLRIIGDRLAAYADFPFEELAEVAIVEAGSTLDGFTSISGVSVLPAGAASFPIPVELIVRHSRWIEATFILSDDGFGLVLLIEVADTTDQALLTLCELELQQHEASASNPIG